MNPSPVITELDAVRLRELGSRELVDLVSFEADIVPGERIGADVVTVNSKVTFVDPLTNAKHTVTLVYPQEFSIADRRISVLSPVGRALLGRRVGQVGVVAMPDGTERHIRIVQLHYQPEAAGELTR